MIFEKYGFQNVKTKPIQKGTESDALLVQSGEDKFILRRLKNVMQAEMEYGISFLLKGNGVVPEILLTTGGKSYAEYKGYLYNLQKYIEGNPISNVNEALVAAIAKQTAIMHKALSSYETNGNGQDRFSLKEAIARTNGKQGPLITALSQRNKNPAEFEKCCEALIALEEQKNQLIHGDLGFWNMIQSGEQVYLIDFGECRMGSIYFDVAAVMASALSKSSPDHFLQEVYHPFVRTYHHYNCALDCEEIFQFMLLWYIRGIYALMLDEKRECEQEKGIAYFFQEIEKCEKVFSLIL